MHPCTFLTIWQFPVSTLAILFSEFDILVGCGSLPTLINVLLGIRKRKMPRGGYRKLVEH